MQDYGFSGITKAFRLERIEASGHVGGVCERIDAMREGECATDPRRGATACYPKRALLR